MDKKKAAPNGTAQSKTSLYSTDTNTQNKRLLKALSDAKSKGMTSYDVREDLDIYCPTARISDLRKARHVIHTIWETIDTGKAKHRVARWVLISKVGVAA